MKNRILKRTVGLLLVLAAVCALMSCTHEHQWDEGTVIKEATCLEEGTKEYKCILCDESYTEPIAKAELYRKGVRESRDLHGKRKCGIQVRHLR